MIRCASIAFMLLFTTMVKDAGAQMVRWPSLPVHRTALFNAEAVQLDDQRRADSGELELYARTMRLQATSWNEGAWTVEGDERVCRIAVRSPGAQAIELLLEEVSVPQGAVLLMRAFNGQELTMPVSLLLPPGVMEYATPMVHADEAVLEYRQPRHAAFEGRFAINGLLHAYRYVDDVVREGSCHVNVACAPESLGWENAINATVRIGVVTPQGSGWCSGTLMNNVRQDCTPYILSAFHCGRTSTTAQFNQYKFYFNFHYANCAGGSYSTAQFLTGAQRIAHSDDYVQQYQGLGGSDFLLVRINMDIPTAFQPFWAGWDATSIANVAADGVCVHHPTGAPKRISSYTETLTTGHPMASSGLMSHYKLRWAPTQNGHGVTELGSSGAGLFKPGAGIGPLLIGTLTGSSSGMSCTNNSGTSYFGKMSYHWTNNPNTAEQKLHHWLDPDATGTLVLGGSADPCGILASIAPEGRTTPLVVRPNPASSQLTVELPSPLPGAQALMTDMAGHLVAQWDLAANTTTINIQDLPNGTYLLSVMPAHGTRPLRTKVAILH